MTTHDPDDEFFDAGDDLAALDFAAPEIDDAPSGLDALASFAADETGGDGGYGNFGLDNVHHHASTDSAADDDEDDGFGALAAHEPGEEEPIPVVQAVNPPGTVTVTAYLNGSVAQVDLDSKVTKLTESQLAEEIRFIADVAAKKATAVVHIGVVNMMVEQGMDIQEARDFVATNMPFSTPEQAGEAELALVARHAHQPD